MNQSLPHEPDDQTPTVRAYPRVSTDAQDEARQRASLEALIEKEYPGWPVEWYVEHGVSAYHVPVSERPESKSLLADLQSGDVIVADDQDRLSRGREVEQAGLVAFVQEREATIHTVTQGIVGDDPSSRILWSVKGILANLESATKGHRIAGAHAERAAAGHYSHGDAAPGYRFNRETKELDATDDLPVIAEIFRRFIDGAAYGQLCAYATENVSAAALVRRKNSLSNVSRDRLRGWLSNPIYAGLINHRGETHPGTHTPAVDLPTWEQAQNRLAKLARDNSKREPTHWPFQGIVKCEGGKSVRPHPARNRWGTNYYYTRCSDPECQKRHGSLGLGATEHNLVLNLAAVALAVENLLLSDPTFAVPSDGGPTMEEAQTAAKAAGEEATRLTKLIALTPELADDPDVKAKLDLALRARDRATSNVARILGSARDHRDDLAELAASVLALADLAPPDEEAEWLAEESVTIIGKGSDHTYTIRRGEGQTTSLLQLLNGWRAADFEQRRSILTRALDKAIVSTESIELHFRAGLPEPITLGVQIGAVGRSEERETVQGSGLGGFATARPSSTRAPATRG